MRTEAAPDIAQSLADVVEGEVVAAPDSRRDAPPDLLIEVPHGATRQRHFAATRSHLTGEFPDDLADFFHLNTDVGSIECARWVARMVTHPAEFPETAETAETADEPRALAKVLILRGLVARTFIDCNRLIETPAAGPTSSLQEGLTPALPTYVRHAPDVETLVGMHRDYQSAAARAYKTVCGPGGTALILHTYAPRSVRISGVDDGIVAALRRAYEPGTYETWDRRPDVDLITESEAAERLAPKALARALRERYARIGVEAAENATYRLHQTTMGYVRSAGYPDQVLCMEINRELLVDRFTPFLEMSVSETKARRMAAPIAAALLGG